MTYGKTALILSEHWALQSHNHHQPIHCNGSFQAEPGLHGDPLVYSFTCSRTERMEISYIYVLQTGCLLPFVTPNKQCYHTHTHTHTFNGPLSGNTQMGRYQKGKTNLDFTEARDSEWQWHQLGHMQVCTSLQTDNHASTPPLSFCRPDALPAAQPTASKH